MDSERLETRADWEPYYPVVASFWPIETESDYTAAMERMTESGYRAFGVRDAEPVGFAGWYTLYSPWFDRFVWLVDLVVRADKRGQGIGTILIEAVESWGREENCSSIVLSSGTERTAAHEFYEERGFEHTELWYEKSLEN